MGCGASTDVVVSTNKGSGKGPDPFWSLQGDPELGDNKHQASRVDERKENKESRAATKKEKESTQEQIKVSGNQTPAGETDNDTRSTDDQPPPNNFPTSESSAQKTASAEEEKEDRKQALREGPDKETNPSDAPSTPPIPSTPPTVPVADSSPQNSPSNEEQHMHQDVRVKENLDDRNTPTKETCPNVLEVRQYRGETKEAAEKSNADYRESDTVKAALVGDIDMTCPSPTKIVRIFTSSTFTDTKNERNMLMKHAYPKVKDYCRRIGYEFQVVDMRWGVRDEATDDHMGTEICLKELQLCQGVSTGPNFVSLLSHKYGYTAFPRVIEAEEFETIMANVDDEESKKLFERWYTLDNNAVPPAYILSPISSRLPDFLSLDTERKKHAKQTWWDESEKMQYALDVTATKVFDKERARKYIMSVTETEITEGLLKSENPSKHSLWFRRVIEDIEEQESCYLLSRYIECMGPAEKWQKSREMLKELKEDKIAEKLSADKIITYNVKWNHALGINPDDERHQAYLDTLCKDFVTMMTDMIDAGVAERALVDDHLVEGCCQHIRFCQSKCEGFQGRQDTLELIRTYVQGSSSEPLVLHGTSGTGKTSIMAMAAKMMKQWTTHPPALVLRFLGTSPDSSSIMSLLESLTSQIRRIYNKPPFPSTTSDIDDKIFEFKEALKMGRPGEPLILMLDSLDQLDPAYDARKLGWLVTQLAPGTKVIVSTLPEPIYDCFPALQAELKSDSSFVSVPVLDNSDVKTILDNWLTTKHRRLADHQMSIVLDAFRKCPTPLFLKLSFEEAATWTSYMPADKTVLQDTVRAGIDFLFQKLEKIHGTLLVSRALGYLTIANSGATEAELEDILSCDDDVLNDVYMYWTPPIRRLPPLLLVRIRTDLSEYLVERGADGVRVIYWYHRQFIEAAEARYCSDKTTNRLIHERLADFFNGTWADGKGKPYTNAKGENGEEDRHVSSQPLKFGPNQYNLRTLNNLPFHLIHAGKVDLLKDRCLANPRFLMHKLEAVPFHSVLKDFTLAKQMFKEDSLIKEILEALNLSEKALTTDARQIIPQLLQRLRESNASKQLLERCREYPSTYILPTKHVLERAGGQLVHSISAHRKHMNMVGITTDGSLAVTSSWYDDTAIIWDVKTAKKQREVKGLYRCNDTYFCNHDKWLAIGLRKKVIIQTVDTGLNVMTLPVVDTSDRGSDPAFCPLGKGRTFLMLFRSNKYKLMNLLADPGEELMPIKASADDFKFSGRHTGSDNYLAVILDNLLYISVYDLNAREFRPCFRGFPEIREGEGVEIEGIVISRDETHLIYTSGETSEVVFADFDGNRLRSIPPDNKRWYEHLNLTKDGSLLIIADQEMLRFFDTRTLQEVGSLQQKKKIIMAISQDGVNVITVADDGILRIWDRSRTDIAKEDESEQFTTKLHRFGSVHVLNNPRYVLLCGNKERDNSPNLYIEVHDVFKNITVKSGEMIGGTDGERLVCTEAFKMKNERQVILVLCEQQIVRVDLETMTVVKNYIGFTTRVDMSEETEGLNELMNCEKTEEIFCTTRGGMHVKIYDKNGDFVTVMKAEQKQRITKIHINVTGTFGCAMAEEGPLMLYDITNRKRMYNIEPENYIGGGFSRTFAEVHVINRAGTQLVFSSESKVAGVHTRRNDLNHMVLWDIQESNEICRLYDAESQTLYDQTWFGNVTSLENIFELDNTRLLSTHKDQKLRVWNINTGELLAQMPGHTGDCYISLCEKSPYICSYSRFGEEDCVRLFDKTTYQCAASFTFDKEVTDVAWSVDGKFLTSSLWYDDPDVATLNIYHGYNQMAVNDTDYPQIFSKKEEITDTMNVKLYKHKELEMEGDPDSDPEEMSEVDDDEDEEDYDVNDDNTE